MQSEDDLSFLSAGGEIAELIRTFDWSATPVGPITAWPMHLRAVVATMLRAPVPVVLFLGEEGILLYNEQYIPIAGRRHPLVLGQPVCLAWPEVADFNAMVLRTVLAGGSLSYRDQEFALLRGQTEEKVWLSLDYFPLVDPAGETQGVVVLVTETTEKVRFQRAVLDDRERLRQMFEQAPSFMAVLKGPDHIFDLTNAAYLQLIGHRDVLGMPVREALPEIAGQGFFEMLDRVYTTGENIVGRGLAVGLQPAPGAPSQERTVDFVYHPIRERSGAVKGIFVEGIDISDRVRAERALRESEQRFRVFAESMPNHVWAADAAGRADWFNMRFYTYAGGAPGAFDEERWLDIVHPEDRDEARARWRNSVETGEPYETEFRLRRADGAYRWHLARAVISRNENGDVQGWIGNNTDIEDQKRTEVALRESELRLRLSQEAAGIASLEVDISAGQVFGSETLWALWGLPAAESVPVATFEDLVDPADTLVRSSDESRHAGTAARSVEYRIRRADTGEQRWIARHIEFVRDTAGRPVKMFGVMRDITAAKEAEMRQRLLTHELEHRIKNILATVSAIASQTLRDTDLTSARKVFDQRLQALAAAHDILNETRWTSASLRAVVSAALAPFRSERIDLVGPELPIGPRRALSLALAVNELGTNSLKYGALSTDVGQVSIRWWREEAGDETRLVWVWQERGGPPVMPPSRRGFGRFLLERVLAADFDGQVRIEFAPDGIVCSMVAPWPTLEPKRSGERT